MCKAQLSISIELLTFILNFVKLTEESVIGLKIILSCHHQLEKAGDFLPDRKCHGKESNNILKAFLEPSSLYARELLDFFYLCLSQRLKKTFHLET